MSYLGAGVPSKASDVEFIDNSVLRGAAQGEVACPIEILILVQAASPPFCYCLPPAFPAGNSPGIGIKGQLFGKAPVFVFGADTIDILKITWDIVDLNVPDVACPVLWNY